MAIKRTKKYAEEKLTPSNIEKVISLLESDKPILISSIFIKILTKGALSGIGKKRKKNKHK